MKPSKGPAPTVLGAIELTPELSSAEEPVLKDRGTQDPQPQDSAKQLPVFIIAYRLRFIFGLIWLTTLQYGSISPSVLYTSTSFFAGGDADCSVTPDSHLCKKGAADLAYWNGWSRGISHSIAWIMALGLGSWSDRHGRRPLFRAKAICSILPVVAIALHIGFDVSLWVYLLLVPAYETFDTNGVFLAFMNDVVKEHNSRALAFGVLIVGAIIGAAPVFPIAGLLPARIAVVVSLLAAVLKLGYMFTIFPETSAYILSEASDQPKPSMAEIIKQAFAVFGRNSFIFRMVFVLVLGGISGAGLGAVMTPMLTAYLGMKKDAMTFLGFACGASVIVSMLGLLPVFMASLGPVRSLRVCLAISAVYPMLFAGCTNAEQVTLLSALLVGPMFLQFPIISAIKSNLVGEEEQGLVQGALAAVRVLAVAVADIFFGWFYRFATDDGEGPQHTTVVPLGLTALLAVAALLIACTLPNEPPPPPGSQPGLDDLASISSRWGEASGGSSSEADGEEGRRASARHEVDLPSRT